MLRTHRLSRRRALATLTGLPVLPIVAGSSAAASFSTLIFFDWQSSVVTPVARESLARFHQRIAAGAEVTIVGHCDTAEANPTRLSLVRAQEVQKLLVARGVPAGATLTIKGMGAAAPLVRTGPNVRDPQNRRVEITID